MQLISPNMFLFLIVKVVPNAGKQALILDKSGNLKCYLKNAPENGKANLELIKFLAKNLHITQHEVEIVAGATSRNKKIKIITNLSYQALLQALGIMIDQAAQKTIF